MTQAENHLILIEGARTLVEMGRQLESANNACTGCTFENGATSSDELGMSLECVTEFEFADGSRLCRTGDSVWADGAWSSEA